MAAKRTTAPPPALVQKIGNTTYEVSFHFSTTSRETMSDKINRLIRRELDAS
ncbi:transposon-encoded TnpW family protein [uncultured Oscillibacter sp.]|uniref:transposon-encoded TnpW family protein n=1 Tax=uncultured Oscillibacter sp. TaxID=876091 RepID=UPI00266F55FC|nr:transposon-encoded TnpW family protein [uncultured Oscillibacter sp.]